MGLDVGRHWTFSTRRPLAHIIETVGNAGLIAMWLVVSACGRIGFDLLGATGDARNDAADGDGTSGDSAVAPSCTGLAATCGPSGTSPCCGSSLVPGGTFYRGYDGADGTYNIMSYPATVSDFRLDTYDVTVGRFRQFVIAGMGTQANPPSTGAGARMLNGMASQGGWNPGFTASLVVDTATLVLNLRCNATYETWTDTPGSNESLPINCITWFEAMAFCTWDGGFLPTEAEWNYAAAGGNEQRAYVWSSPPTSLIIDCTYTNYFPTPYCVNPATGAHNRVGSESPKGDAKWGQADLGGNAWNWTLDWQGPYSNPCNDCANLTAGAFRALRGGSFYYNQAYIRTSYRSSKSPANRFLDVGIRCARIP